MSIIFFSRWPPITCQVVNLFHISDTTSHDEFSFLSKIYLVEKPMIITHGGKLNVTSTIELATIIGYVDPHWLYVIILEIPLLYQKLISH